MKTLLAVDGSSFSRTACELVASQMRPQGAEVLVLQVVEPFFYSTPPQMAPGYAPEMVERLQDLLKQAEGSVAQAAESLRTAGFTVHTRVVEAEVRTGILDVAAEWHADVIVLGSHGRRGLERFMLGSVAESVARHARCSVLIVRTSRPT
jgi:nucleotide-binding universal stress UspA family protein